MEEIFNTADEIRLMIANSFKFKDWEEFKLKSSNEEILKKNILITDLYLEKVKDKYNNAIDLLKSIQTLISSNLEAEYLLPVFSDSINSFLVNNKKF